MSKRFYIILFLIFCITGVIGYYFTPTAIKPGVNKENFLRLYRGMDKKDVIAILGPPEAEYEDTASSWRAFEPFRGVQLLYMDDTVMGGLYFTNVAQINLPDEPSDTSLLIWKKFKKFLTSQ